MISKTKADQGNTLMKSVLRFCTSVAIFASVVSLANCDSRDDPDLIVHNANVITIDVELPSAQAFAVRDGLFLEVGNDEDILALAGSSTEIMNANGRTVIPGINDAHLHALAIPPGTIDLGGADTVDAVVALLEQRAATVEPGAWILGYGYDDTALGRHLTSADLDRVTPDNPVLALHASMHLFAANSHALGTAGITAETSDPEGGRFYRDSEDKPTGLISERPALEMLFVEQQPSFFPHDLTSAVEGLETFFEIAHSNGITSFSDAMVPPELALAYWWADPEDAGIRVNLMFDGDELETATTLDNVNGVLSWIGLNLFDTPWLRAKTVKLFHGHSLSGRTTRLIEPYADRPNYYGETPQRNQDELNAIISEIHNQGFQAAVHANGDFEVDMVVKAIEQATSDDPREHRHRIEHASVTNDDLLNRIASLGIVIAPHSYIYEKGPMIEAYGEARWPHMFANASIIANGIPNAANSDFPVSPLHPFLRIQSLLTRTSRAGKTYGASQRLTLEQALYAYTMGGAFATFEENDKGSITPGKFADFVILSQDPHTVPPLEVRHIFVEATYVGGALRFEK
jgi:predicted amidohydrolase YtcJ